MTTPDAELRPLDYEAVAASYKERRPAQAAAPKGQFGVLPDLLLIAAWLVAAAAVGRIIHLLEVIAARGS